MKNRTLVSIFAALIGASIFCACTESDPASTVSADAGGDGRGDASGMVVSDAGDSGCTTSATGALTVRVTGLPTGVSGAITVTGPSGAASLTATTTNASARSGDYSVTAAQIVTQADPIVRSAFKPTITIAAAHLCDGGAASLEVAYALIGSSNKLWWGNQNGTNATLGYASASLAATSTLAATVAAGTAGRLPGAFDRDGNLWLIDGIAGSVGVKRYAADTLATSGDKVPSVVLSSDAFTGGIPGPAAMTFDASGNLWVAVTYSNKVVKLNAARLATTGAVVPDVELSGFAVAPQSLAFDRAGNLWVGAGNRIHKYAAARLGASTAAAADTSIEALSPPPVILTLAQPLGLAFDATDNLWVNYDGVIAKITAAEQTAGASPITPSVQIVADVLALPEGIAIDEAGGLWMAYSAGKFAKFSAAQLAASGTLAPAVVITSTDVASATSPAFYPAPAALPLFSALP